MRQASYIPHFYIEVADVEGGIFHHCLEYPQFLATQDLAEKAAEESLNRYMVARVCQEIVTFKREP